MDKKTFRKEMIKKRDLIPPETRHEKSLIITEKLLAEEVYKDCREVFCYLSFRSETETEGFINTALNDGKTVALPYMTKNKGEMVFIKINSLSELVKNSFGIYEPKPAAENTAEPGNKTIIIVPGVAFSRDSFRMGCGGGYYDRYLSRYGFMCKIGICFAEQICENIPTDEYDIRMDKVITG
ncbi:MAG: 5-formyltetrahydrofolate cyclo-ligase [Clostridiales bacterium]|nr:5-formyltetrahydrofolate cyclo-ligase [Clostridiales bacterium]